MMCFLAFILGTQACYLITLDSNWKTHAVGAIEPVLEMQEDPAFWASMQSMSKEMFISLAALDTSTVYTPEALLS